jgi:hypothetical protein
LITLFNFDGPHYLRAFVTCVIYFLFSSFQWILIIFMYGTGWTGQLIQYSVWLRTGRPRFDPRQRQAGSGAHPASCTMGTGGSLPWGKERPERDADLSPPSSAKVKEE